MLRFGAFEGLGPQVVGISDIDDGDCALGAVHSGGRDTLMKAFGLAVAPLSPRQVHGTAIWRIREVPRSSAEAPEADAILTNVPGIPVGVTVADCVPVFLYAPAARAGGVVHAGREGTFENISGAAVASLAVDFGVDPGDVHALIGPSAGPCCYEVSPELRDAFVARGLPVTGRHLDLWGANATQLAAAGVLAGNITLAGHCTICGKPEPRPSRFHSYRGTGTAARNLALMVL